MHDGIETLMNRRSIRKYKPQQIDDAQLDIILQAGMAAPSAKNKQPSIIIVLQDKDDISYLSKLNAAVLNRNVDPFFGAPTVLIVLADANNINAVQDGSLVMGNLMNAAYAIGLGSCWINRAREVFDSAEGKALLNKWGIEGEYIGVGNCIVGIPDEFPQMKPRKDNYVYYVR